MPHEKTKKATAKKLIRVFSVLWKIRNIFERAAFNGCSLNGARNNFGTKPIHYQIIESFMNSPDTGDAVSLMYN